MKNHVKVYMDYYGFGMDDVILCEGCGTKRAQDVHHLVTRSHGGKDEIENLIGVCRDCHSKAHNDREYNTWLRIAHKMNLIPEF